MKFKILRMLLLRKKLKSNNFYEDINFENRFVSKNVKRNILKWFFYLWYYHDIKIEKFKDLFSKLSNEIVFPITIKQNNSYCNLAIVFIDSEEKEYYMIKEGLYTNLDNYVIGRRNSKLEPLIDRDFNYRISKDETIVLKETGAMLLNKDGKNIDIMCDFSYNTKNNTTNATLKSNTLRRKICIEYPTKGAAFDKMVLNYLLIIREKTEYYYNVFPILRKMLQELATVKVSISVIALKDDVVCSKIEVIEGIVKEYTKSKAINEEEMVTKKKIFGTKLKYLEEFLKENE